MKLQIAIISFQIHQKVIYVQILGIFIRPDLTNFSNQKQALDIDATDNWKTNKISKFPYFRALNFPRISIGKKDTNSIAEFHTQLNLTTFPKSRDRFTMTNFRAKLWQILCECLLEVNRKRFNKLALSKRFSGTK